MKMKDFENHNARLTELEILEVTTEDPVKFKPSWRAWVCGLVCTTFGAAISPLFLFRAFSMPFSPLFVPAMVYPICKRTTDSSDSTQAEVQHRNVFRRWIARLSKYWGIQMFSRDEMVWIVATVAAGSNFAPAYQWIATLDIDYGRPLTRWQKFLVVLSSQLVGWTIGHIMRHMFVGRGNGLDWPDTLPLAYLIQTLFPSKVGNNPDLPSKSTEPAKVKRIATNDSGASSDNDSKSENNSSTAYQSSAAISISTAVLAARKRYLALLTLGMLVYQVILSYMAPIFKSLCLLCIWASNNRILGQLGSGWSGAGILSLTFDWTAMATLLPLVTPLWAQVHYYVGAILMLYIITPVAWFGNWWGSHNLPIVSTNVFDIGGNSYNISLIRPQQPIDFVDQHLVLEPTLYFSPYSPVRLTANSALGYICSVAAIIATFAHLVIWHNCWLSQAMRSIYTPFLRLLNLRLALIRLRERPLWNMADLAGRTGVFLLSTTAFIVPLLSKQLGISILPGWQGLLALVWACVMCLPIGFVEAMTGFTLPIDLIPHILGGWMQAPGRPIEASYFHLWATVPTQVALGWSGVRSYQLAYSCSSSIQKERYSEDNNRQQLPWMKRGLLVGTIWGAWVNHLSYSFFCRADVLKEDFTGWREEGEFGRLPASLSSELVVWGIIGPKSMFGKESPYRLLFVYGLMLGLLLPIMMYLLYALLHKILIVDSKWRQSWPQLARILGAVAFVAKEIQIPLVLAGMVAVPTMPANFVITGLVVAVIGQWWCHWRKKTLVDRALYSAAMGTGARLAVAVLYGVEQILEHQNKQLAFVAWWGNQLGNVERCADF